MPWKIRTAFFLVLVFVTTRPCYGQYRDAGLWLSVNLEKKIASRTTVLFSEECRMTENISQAGTLFSDLGLMHKWNKFFSAGFFYRFIQKRNLDASYSTRHRFYADVSGKYKTGRWSVSLRERIQSQVKDFYSSETGRIPEWYLRSKLSLKVELTRKIIPYAGVELFYQLSNREGNEFDNVRYTGGIEYRFNKRHAVEAGYLIQHEFHVRNPASDFVSCLSYNFSF